MNTPSVELHELIKSLKQTEKRYFKVFASKQSDTGGNQYIKLFNAIDKMDNYDEAALRKKFKDEKFIKQFHVVKNYLQHSIIRSLVSYHSDSSANTQILFLLQSIERLFDKGLYSLCMKNIEKGIVLTKKYEKLQQLNLFLEWKGKLLIRKSAYHEAVEGLKAIQTNFDHLKNGLNSKINAFAIYEKAIIYGFTRSKEQIQYLEKEFSFVIKQPELKNATIEERYYHYSSIGLYYSCVNNQKKRLECYKKIIMMLDKKTDFIYENPHLYISAINNYCTALINFGEANEIIKYTNSARNIFDQKSLMYSDDAKMLAYCLSYNIEINICILIGKIEDSICLESNIENIIECYKEKIQKTNVLDLIFNTSYMFFVAEKYDKALYWINKIMNSPRIPLREDLQMTCKIFSLMIHYELKNELLLQNIIYSTERYLKAKKKLFSTERFVIYFFKSILHVSKPFDKKTLFNNLKCQLEQTFKDPYEKNITNYVDIISWVESKQSDIPLQKIISQKYSSKIKNNVH